MRDGGGRSVLVTAGLLGGLAVGVGEAARVVFLAGEGVAGIAGVLAIVFGVWALGAAGATAALELGLRAALGPEAEGRARGKVLGFLSALRRERGSDADARRAGAIVGAAVGLGGFLGTSFLVVLRLVRTWHDPVLIAVGAVAMQAAAAALWLVVGLAAGRGVAWLGRRSGGRISAAAVLGGLGAVVLAGIGFVVFRSWETLRVAEIGGVLLPAAALLLASVLWLSLPARAAVPRRRLVSAFALGLALVLLGSLVPAARRAVAREGATSSYVLAALSRASDFDRDGAATPPFGDDCAPFDASTRPFAPDPAGDGADRNCDGEDGLAVAGVVTAPHPDVGPFRKDEAPDLLLVTVDSLRADHMGFLGYERPTTPEIDRWAKGAAVFSRAFSQDSGTGPSLWSLAAGKTPFQVALLDAHRFPPRLGPEETTLAEALSARGYETSAVLCGKVFRSFDVKRGFGDYKEVCGSAVDRQAPKVAADAESALGRLRRRDAPFFLWVHFFDPHHDYFDHPDLDFGTSPVDLYDEEIRFTDAFVARVLRAAAAPGRDRRLYVAFTADHGENFGEHGRAPHARTLYREVTNVPLAVAGPDVVARRIDSVVAMNDLYPTFLHLAGVPIPEASTMRSLVPVLRGADPDPGRFVFQENSYSRPRRDVKAVVHGRHHLLHDLTSGVSELYDYEADPRETRDLTGEGLPEEATLRAALEAFLQTVHTPEVLSP